MHAATWFYRWPGWNEHAQAKTTMGKASSFRFYVESSGGRRSTTWNVTVDGNDIYVTPRFAKSSKISLHQSGCFQWSMRSEVVESAPYVPETGRHIAKWRSPKHFAGDFTYEFFIFIAAAELRQENPTPTKKASRLHAPESGQVVLVDFFLSKTLPDGPVEFDSSPLFSTRLQDGRLLVLFKRVMQLDEKTAETLRAVKAIAWRAQHDHGKKNANGLVKLIDERGVSGMAEIAPAPALMVFRAAEPTSAFKFVPAKR